MSLLKELELLQDNKGYLPLEGLNELAEKYEISLPELMGRASFYSFFRFALQEEKSNIENIYPCRREGILIKQNGKYSWEALEAAKKNPMQALEEIKEARLAGRSGGAFPTGTKWQITADVCAAEKAVVCNADEGEPGTGKDRVLLERNPYAVIEGMAICAAVVGAEKGYIYLRGEYADLKEQLETVIKEAPLENFAIELCMGHGSYVCGEETALLNSLEGRRGDTRLKPPFPGVSGLYGMPTVVNNVETFACVPLILKYGAETFRSWGCEDYAGPKLFTIYGAVREPGVYELQPGTTLEECLKAAGAATEPVQAFQIGGGSGSIIKPDCLDMTLSPEGCAKYEASLGVASIRVIGESENLVSEVRKLTEFFVKESCGTCVPCRVGLQRARDLLSEFECGNAYPEDLAQLESVLNSIRTNSRCGLGQAAVMPAISLIKHFPEVLVCR